MIAFLLCLNHASFSCCCLLDVYWDKTSSVIGMCLHDWLNERMNNEQVSERMSE